MRWFGPSWNAVVNQECEHTTVPQDRPCDACGQPFRENDQGFELPHMGLPDDDARQLVVNYHRHCMLAMLGIGVER